MAGVGVVQMGEAALVEGAPVVVVVGVVEARVVVPLAALEPLVVGTLEVWMVMGARVESLAALVATEHI